MAGNQTKDRRGCLINEEDIANAVIKDEEFMILNSPPLQSLVVKYQQSSASDSTPATKNISYFPLLNAVKAFDLPTIQHLLKHGANLFQLDSMNQNLLHQLLLCSPTEQQEVEFFNVAAFLISQYSTLHFVLNISKVANY